jgi:hypothetical protein
MFRHSVEDIYVSSAWRRKPKQKLYYDFIQYSMKLYTSGEGDVLRYYQHFLVLIKSPPRLMPPVRGRTSQRTFWLSFQPEDRAVLYLPSSHCQAQPAGISFGFQEVFVQLCPRLRCLSFLQPQHQWDDLSDTRSNGAERLPERWFGRE